MDKRSDQEDIEQKDQENEDQSFQSNDQDTKEPEDNKDASQNSEQYESVQETESSSQSEDRKSNEPLFNSSFAELVIGLQSRAWQFLGKAPLPDGSIKVDLNIARDAIDTLIMLRDKTQGNLNEVERGLLENSLNDLQMHFIEATKKENKES